MLDEYKANMDWLRKHFGLPDTTSLYDIVNTVSDAYRLIIETKEAEETLKELEKSLKGEKDDGKRKGTDNRNKRTSKARRRKV